MPSASKIMYQHTLGTSPLEQLPQFICKHMVLTDKRLASLICQNFGLKLSAEAVRKRRKRMGAIDPSMVDLVSGHYHAEVEGRIEIVLIDAERLCMLRYGIEGPLAIEGIRLISFLDKGAGMSGGDK